MARILVEVAKKTWPQHWPTFISDIFSVEDQVHTYPLLIIMSLDNIGSSNGDDSFDISKIS